MASTTRLLIKQDIVRILAQDDEAVSQLPVPGVTTADGSVTTIKDDVLSRGSEHANKYDGRVVQIVELVTDGTPLGEVSAVNAGGLSTNTLTFSPAFTVLTKSGANYILYPRGHSPEVIDEAINDVLRRTQGRNIWFPSLVADSDLEVGDASTNWDNVVTPTSAHTKVAAEVLLGAGSLHISAISQADEGITSDTFDVHETEQLTVAVFVKVKTGSCVVQLYRETAPAAVVKAVTVDEPGWTQIQFSEPVPNDVEQMRIRFVSAAASDDFFIGAHVIVQPDNYRPYAFPDWLLTQNQVTGSFYLPRGLISEDTDSYVALSERFVDARTPDTIRDDRAVNPGWLHTRSRSQGPIGFYAYREFDTLSSETATTTADRDYVTWRTVAALLEQRGDGRFRLYRDKARARAKALKYGGRRLTIEEAALVAV